MNTREIFFIVFLFMLFGVCVLSAQNLTIAISPQTTNIGVNETVTLNVTIENASNLGGFQFDVLYNTQIVHVDTVILGDFISSTGRGAFQLGPEIDNNSNPGKVTFGGASFGSNPGPDGNGILAQVTFTSLGTGNSAVELQNVLISDINGQNLPVSGVIDGGIIVSGTVEADFVVTNTNDSGEGSLRWAIMQANATPGADVIHFAIPYSDPGYDSQAGVWTIQPLSYPEPITDDSLLLDGSSQADFIGSDTNPFGPEIVINGEKIEDYALGFNILSSYNTIKGFVVNGFSADGISINGNYYAVKGNKIQGCYIGTNAAGTDTIPNGIGIRIMNSSENIIGGADPNSKNLISGNELYGVYLEGEGTKKNLIIGNYIGTNASGTSALSNGNVGLYLEEGVRENIIGGKESGMQNLISGNVAEGIRIKGPRNTILGNLIGTDITGKNPIGNYDGISLMFGADSNIIGGLEPGEGNVIAASLIRGIVIVSDYNQVAGNFIGTDFSQTAALGNQNEGVSLTYGAQNNIIGPQNVITNNNMGGVRVLEDNTNQNTITKNSIYNNVGKGITNWNGANAGLSPPEITSFSDGIVFGTAPANATVEIFSDDDDEGKIYEGTVIADNNGNFQWSGSPTGPQITATATDASGNTSEFSQPYLITSVAENKDEGLPKKFELKQNYPNPFNPQTTIFYQIPEKTHVSLTVSNILGKELIRLVNEQKEPGVYFVKWQGKDHAGRLLSSGVYFYRLVCGEFVQTKKMLLLR